MSRSSRACRCRVPYLVAVLGLAAASGLPRRAGAQADSTASALRLSIAAGPTLAARVAGASRLGYAIQGAVTLMRRGAPWRMDGAPTGAVRASIGVATDGRDIARLLGSLEEFR